MGLEELTEIILNTGSPERNRGKITAFHVNAVACRLNRM
jgi:hypothetical protein